MEVLQRTANRGSVSTAPHEIDNSVKFEADNTERMYRAWGAGGGNDQTWTLSLWVKRTELGTLQHIWGAGVSGNDVLLLSFQTDNTLKFRSTKDSANDCVYVTNRVFRDTSAWYHIVTAVDTTSGTAGDRLRIYINGVEETSFSTETDFAQNDNTLHNANSSYVEIATAIGEADRFCGYISEVVSISGSQLAPTTFGETDSNTGIWIPKKYTGSFPQNSFKLEFKDSSSLGTETSGNGQTFTLQNITAADQATDTPTNNFCTLNPLVNFKYGTNTGGMTNGATVFGDDTGGGVGGAFGTMAVTAGKWYWEMKLTQQVAHYPGISAVDDGDNIYTSSDPQEENSTFNYNISAARREYVSGGSLTYGSLDEMSDFHSTGDIISIALNMDDNQISIYGNGTLQSGIANSSIFDAANKMVVPFHGTINDEVQYNFGGYSVWTPSSAESDANGYGTFEYAPPSGYYALCTKNLSEFGG